MKYFIILTLLTGMFLTTGSSQRGNDLFQVISSHPHALEDINPYIETVYQNGRLHVVQLKSDAPADVLAHLRPLTGHEKSYMYEGLFTKSLKTKAKNPITAVLQQVDKNLIRKDVEELAAYETRAAGTSGNQEAVKKTAQRFKSLGYEISEICYSYDACSIIAEKKGKVSPDQVIMVMGHIDSVGESFAGADDNASGTAVILEMARVLKNTSNKKTIRFFVTNGEELGMYGASHYARHLQSKDELKNLALVINMDMVGYNSNGVVELETEPEHEPLAQWFADLASMHTKLKTKITLGAWGSDHVPFLRKGVPSLLTIENWDTKTPCYHQECDTPDTLNYNYAAEIAKLNVAAVLTKDQN